MVLRCSRPPASGSPPPRGSICLHRFHSTSGGAPGFGHWGRLAGRWATSAGSGVSITEVRSPRRGFRFGRCRTLGRGGSAHRVGAAGGLAVTICDVIYDIWVLPVVFYPEIDG